MEYTLPDKLTFKRAEVIKIAKLDGKVLDYWEQEFGNIAPTVNITGEKFYTQKDVQTIMKIKQLMIVERIEKAKIKKILSESNTEQSTSKPNKDRVQQQRNHAEILQGIKKGLLDILTILNKNGKR